MWATIYLAGQAALWSSMRAGPEARQAIVGAMVGLLYGSVLIVSVIIRDRAAVTVRTVPFIAVISAAWRRRLGALIISPVASHLGGRPDGTALGTLLVWAGLGSLVALSGRGKSLRLARILVLLQYASGFALVAIDQSAWNVRVFHTDLWRASSVMVSCVGDALPAWAGGVVVATKQAQSNLDRPSNHRVWTQFSLPAPQRPAESNRAA